MTDEIKDITPEHHPVALLRDCEPLAQGAVAGAVILLNKDDELIFENCGVTRKDLLWMLTRMQNQLMNPE